MLYDMKQIYLIPVARVDFDTVRMVRRIGIFLICWRCREIDFDKILFDDE